MKFHSSLMGGINCAQMSEMRCISEHTRKSKISDEPPLIRGISSVKNHLMLNHKHATDL